MQGEELNAVDVVERGLLGDRAFALIDAETGKVASAKNPRRWPNLYDFRAAFLVPPASGRGRCRWHASPSPTASRQPPNRRTSR